LIGFRQKTIPEDKNNGTSETKVLKFPHEKMTDLFMIAFDEIRQAEAVATKREILKIEENPPDDFELVKCQACSRRFKIDRIDKHFQICNKSKKNPKRKEFEPHDVKDPKTSTKGMLESLGYKHANWKRDI